MNEVEPEPSTEELYQSYLDAATTPQQLGFTINDRIEVRWTIERDDPPSSEKKWWGARLISVSEAEPKLVTLLYDAFEGFEETQCDVLLLNENTLYDIEQNSELYWRKEGDLVDTSDFKEVQEETVSIEEVLHEMEQFEPAAETALESLPHATQINLAEGIAKFKTEFVGFVHKIHNERGPNTTITSDDVEDFVSKMKDWTKPKF